MGRHATGWKIGLRDGAKTWTVYWWSVEEQRQVELSTGETDPKRAAEAAPKIYADHAHGKLKSRGVKPSPSLDLEPLAVNWITSMKGLISDDTLAIYSIYFESQLVKSFPNLTDVTTAKAREFITRRLSEVSGKSVRKELSPLRGLVSWAAEKGYIQNPPMIPGVPKKALGTPFSVKRRKPAVALTPEEVEAFLAALPIWKVKLGFVRPRFILTYEMALRTSLVDRLSSPEHWYPGSLYLDLDAFVMKNREPTGNRLTARAIQTLEQSYSKPGPIYGAKDYRLVVQEAAKALPEEKRGLLNASHLRSAGITHYCARGATLNAAQRFANHKLSSTTDRYMRATERDNEDELRRQGRL